MPDDLARRDRAGRAQTARDLIEATDLSVAAIAFAAGYTDMAELDAAVRREYATSPALLRGHPGRSHDRPVRLSMRLAVRQPFAYAGVLGHLAAGAVPGCEEVRGGAYRRALRLPHGNGIVALTPRPDHVRCVLSLDDRRDLAVAIGKCRRLLDLDADPQPVIDVLAADPALRTAVLTAPGQRIPGTVDESELALRVVLSQQVSLKAAATHAGRLVAAYGDRIADPDGGLTHTFPSVGQLTELDPDRLALPRTRRRTFTTLVAALADGTIALSADCDHQRTRAQLLALPGVGPWTVEVIAMRGLGDPDAFPAADLGVRLAAEQLGLPGAARALIAHSDRWRPWRAYATQQLWATLDHSVNNWPPKENT